MMNLMEDEPPSLCVSESVPPIKEERANEPTNEAFEQRHVPIRKLEQGYVAEYVYPQSCCGNGNNQLRQIRKYCAGVPALRVRQFPSWEYALENKENHGRNDYERSRKGDWTNL